MIPPTPFYPNNDNHTPPVFDLRYPGVAERLHREQGGVVGAERHRDSRKECYALIIRPGGPSGRRIEHAGAVPKCCFHRGRRFPKTRRS